MADKTNIEWSDATWNPIVGCSIVSPGCTNCYAMRSAGYRLDGNPNTPQYAGTTMPSKSGPVWTGKIGVASEKVLTQPLRWRKPRMIFVNSMGDLFAEGVTDEMIDRVFAVMALCPQHIFQILTKRPERMREYLTQYDGFGRWGFIEGWALKIAGEKAPRVANRLKGKTLAYYGGANLPNVWIGVSVEDQKRADERIPILLDTPAAIRWISAEPLLGPVDLRRLRVADLSASAGFPMADALTGAFYLDPDKQAPFIRELIEEVRSDRRDPEGIGLDWVVCGGESGKGARPMHPDWARSLRDQCASAGVAFLFKQWGEWAPQVGAVDGWNIGDDPEISRFDHRDWQEDHWSEPFRPMWCDERDDDTVSRIGKKAAGRLLDGVLHDQYPEAM